jgi:nicotinate phosphoribosyltransferase
MPTNLESPRDYFAVARDEAEIQNLTNNDIYKFLMMDFILANPEWAKLKVRWKMKVRSKDIKLGHVIPEKALRYQLDAARAIPGVSQADCTFLRGMLWPTGDRLFQEKTLDVLSTLKLCEYNLEADGMGWYNLTFEGTWIESMLWEILALKIVNTLYLYHKIKQEKISNAEFTQIITETRSRLFSDVKLMKDCPGLDVREFGARRAGSTDIHRSHYEILHEMVPDVVKGTSNVMLAREFGSSNPTGTNAHELRMIPTATVHTSDEIINMMYDIDRQWMKHHRGLGILLPDTFGTTFYFQNAVKYGAMDIIQWHSGCRHDSKDPMVGIPEYVDWLKQNDRDPQSVISIPSDGLTVRSAIDIFLANRGIVWKYSAGIGTHITNNTKGTWPRPLRKSESPFGSFSVVIKPSEVLDPNTQQWVSCVKLWDNPGKSTGSSGRVKLFKEIFGTEGMQEQEMLV